MAIAVLHSRQAAELRYMRERCFRFWRKWGQTARELKMVRRENPWAS